MSTTGVRGVLPHDGSHSEGVMFERLGGSCACGAFGMAGWGREERAGVELCSAVWCVHRNRQFDDRLLYSTFVLFAPLSPLSEFEFSFRSCTLRSPVNGPGAPPDPE